MLALALAHRRRALFAPFAAIATALSACGSGSVAFQPVHMSGRAGGLYPVASYDLTVGTSELGKAKVWSEGVVKPDGVRVFDVQMSIRNTTREPIRVDIGKSTVAMTMHDGRSAPLGTPHRVGGTYVVPPDSSERLGLRYALPQGVGPNDVANFDFDWHVASPAGEYAMSTRFVPSQAVSSGLSDRFPGCFRGMTIDECAGPTPVMSRPLK
jgi:hypothetical protein